MAKTQHVAKLRRGVKAWNLWREGHPDIRPDLSGSDFSNLDLREANLNEADLSGSTLRQTVLNFAQLNRARLVGADLSFARLWKAELQKANLNRANLVKAVLTQANLQGALLGGAKLNFAELNLANFTAARLKFAQLDSANLSFTVFHKADLRGARLNRCAMVRTDLRNANLSGCSVYGVSAWDVQLEGATQHNLVIDETDILTAALERKRRSQTRLYPPSIQVDDLELAQFIHLLLSREKLRNVLSTMGEKAVLILGRFTERKQVLDRMAERLRLLGYLPIIFDFERPTDRDLTETVKILAGLSKFVIADITSPQSVGLELQATIPDYMVPFVTIVEKGKPAFGMFNDLPRKFHWALPLLAYDDLDDLMTGFDKNVVDVAVEKVRKLRQLKASAPVTRSAKD